MDANRINQGSNYSTCKKIVISVVISQMKPALQVGNSGKLTECLVKSASDRD